MLERLGLAEVTAVAVLAGCSGAVEHGFSEIVPQPPSGAGYYSLEQAARGRDSFVEICGECHSSGEFRGRDFEYTWRRQTVWDFFRQLVRTMPEDMPGFLPNETYVDIIAYVLQINQYASGDADLVASEAAMDTIPLGPEAKKQPSQDGAP
jgi:hypothetical protein